MYNGQAEEVYFEFEGKPNIAIVAARFNSDIVDVLIEGAMSALESRGVSKDRITLLRVPGAFELPLAAQHILEKADACIALGAVIRGETPHFDYVAGECARGLMQVALHTKKPVIFGVLTTDTLEQAKDRAGGKLGNKGFDSAMNLVEMLNVQHHIKGL